MDFSAREDIDAPIDFVFENLTDFASFERAIMRRGGEISVLKGDNTPTEGAAWRVTFPMRGKVRNVEATLTTVDAPNKLTFEIDSKNASGTSNIELVSLSPKQTRMIIKVQAKPLTIPARLFFQSLRFAKQRTKRRFQTVIEGFAKDMQSRYQP